MTITSAKNLQSGQKLDLGGATATVLSTAPYGVTKKLVRISIITAEMAVLHIIARKYKAFTVQD